MCLRDSAESALKTALRPQLAEAAREVLARLYPQSRASLAST